MGGIVQPILALVLVLIREEGVRAGEPLAVLPALAGILLYLVVVAVTTRSAVQRHAARGGRDGFSLPPHVPALQFAAFAFFLFATDWVPLVLLRVTSWPVVSTLLALAPYVAGHALRASLTYDALSPDRKGPGKRKALVLFQVRVMAVPLLPLVLINGLRRLIDLDSSLGRLVQAYLPLSVLVLLATVFVVFSAAPLIVRWLVLARPLPAGPLRERLLSYCEHIDYRPTDILVWRTGGLVTNALFIGILPFLRYVVLTDALIEKLDQSEVEAVFAHESGHGMRRHTQLYLLFAAGFTLANVLVEHELLGLAGSGESFALMALVWLWFAGSLALFFLAFGWMSRRFETEADIFAMATLSSPGAFPRALEAVGLHAGALARRGGLRHFGIGTRIGLLNRYLAEPEFKRAFDGVLLRCRGAILLLFVAGALVLGWKAPGFMREGNVQLGLLLYRDSMIHENPDLAERGLEKLMPLVDDPRLGGDARRYAMACLWVLTKDALMKGDYTAAERYVQQLQDAFAKPDLLSSFNRDMLAAMLAVLSGKGDPGEMEHLEDELQDLVDDQDQNVDLDSAYEDFSDLFLARRAAGDAEAEPRHPDHLQPTARLLYLLDRLRAGKDAPSRAELDVAAARALHDGAYRRDLFLRATGGLGPREAVEAAGIR